MSESLRRHVAILLGAWWMADYETLHVCRVPWCQQCVTFLWWPSDPIKFKKRFIVVCVSVRRYVTTIARRMMNGWLWNFACMSGTMMPTMFFKFWWWPSNPITFKKTFYSIIYAILRTWRSVAAAVATRPRADSGGCYATTHRLQQYGRPYQPKHSPSICLQNWNEVKQKT